MKKNEPLFAWSFCFPNLRKVLLLMKLTIAFLLFTGLHVSANSFSQDRITLKLQSVELKTALRQIEKKSDFRFLYNNDVVSFNQKISINAVNSLVTDILDNVAIATGLAYRVLDNNLVVITQKNIEVQAIKVSGKVTNDKGEGLPGVSVKVKGTVTGTTTDGKGNYSISVPEGATLIFSSVGYMSNEVAVNGRTEINVVLQTATTGLNEVVVIGYGTASKRDLTGSITKVLGKDIADKPNTNPVASLQSKVAGLYVVNNGTPGQAPDIRIRGTISLGQVHPLYVVDGIFSDNIDYLNPNDIESIEILKDPSSLAIFGVRGATGVIAVTTKKAKVGQTVINFNTSVGFKKLVNKIQLANAEQFKTLYGEQVINDNILAPDYTGLTSNTDWIDAVTRTGMQSVSNLSIAGRNEKNSFNLGVGYTYDEGIIKHEQLQKMLLSFGDEYKLNNAVKIGVNLNATRQNLPYDATSMLDLARKVMPQVSSLPKTFKVLNPYGSDSIYQNIYSGLNTNLQNSGVVNPLLQLENEWNKTINIDYRTMGNVYADINFLKHFNFRSTWYADIDNSNKRQYVPLYYFYNPATGLPYDPGTGTYNLASPKTRVQEDDHSGKIFQQDYILNYKNKFKEHSLTATGGFTTFYSGTFNRTGKSSQGVNPIPNDKRFWYVENGFEDPSSRTSNSYQSEYTTVSFLVRALYNYKGKYYLNGSYRDDASSRMPEKNRWQKFWALGGAWEISKESFFKVKQIDYLKLKASVGVLGNQSAYDNQGNALDYPFYPKLNSGSNAVFGTSVYSAARQNYEPNPDLKWETVASQEFGVELNAFQNRLHFEANYYNKKTKNLMIYIDRSSLGLNNELQNAGTMRNWGEEFAATWNQKLNKDLNVNIGGNITFQKNKVLSLSNDLPNGIYDQTSTNNGEAISEMKPGMPIAYFKGYIQQGIFQSYADILNSAPQSSLGLTGPGDVKYKDINKDGVIDGNDRTQIGNPTPDFYYGINLNANYKNFSLSVDMGGVYGNEVYRTWGGLESPYQLVNFAQFQMDRWHGAGTSNWTPIVSQKDRINFHGSTRMIEDGSYFRLRNVQLAYNFPTSLLSKVKITNMRVFVNGQNLKTWKHNSGYTAEYGGSAAQFGYDNAGGAIPSITSFGLNVTF